MLVDSFLLQDLTLIQDIPHTFRYFQQNTPELLASEFERPDNVHYLAAPLMHPDTLLY